MLADQLIWAVAQGRTERVALLLENGVDPNVPGSGHPTHEEPDGVRVGGVHRQRRDRCAPGRRRCPTAPLADRCRRPIPGRRPRRGRGEGPAGGPGAAGGRRPTSAQRRRAGRRPTSPGRGPAPGRGRVQRPRHRPDDPAAPGGLQRRPPDGPPAGQPGGRSASGRTRSTTRPRSAGPSTRAPTRWPTICGASAQTAEPGPGEPPDPVQLVAAHHVRKVASGSGTPRTGCCPAARPGHRPSRRTSGRWCGSHTPGCGCRIGYRPGGPRFAAGCRQVRPDRPGRSRPGPRPGRATSCRRSRSARPGTVPPRAAASRSGAAHPRNRAALRRRKR